MTVRGSAAALGVLLAACAAGLPPATGRPALAPPDEAELKTFAVRGARAEIRRAGADAIRLGVLLDTLVGPTPASHRHEETHRTEWLEAMVATHLVDELFGRASERRGLVRRAVVVEVGAPYPQGRDTFAIVYDWCVRSLPTSEGTRSGDVSAWRDAFVRADTGWTLIGHTRVLAPVACSP